MAKETSLNNNKFEILDVGDWISLSDHLPLVFEID